MFLGNGALPDPHWPAVAASQPRVGGWRDWKSQLQRLFRGLLRDLGVIMANVSTTKGGREGEEEGGGGESLVNYGTDAQQYLGVNALRTGAVLALTLSPLFTDSWAPSWGPFSVGFASVGEICKFKDFSLFPNGIFLPPSCLPHSAAPCRLSLRPTPHRAPRPADGCDCFV